VLLLAGLVPLLAPGTSLGLDRPMPAHRPPDALLLAVVATQALPLLARPALALAGTSVGLVVSVLGGFVPTAADLALPAAVFLLVRHGSRRALAVGPVAAAPFVTGVALGGSPARTAVAFGVVVLLPAAGALLRRELAPVPVPAPAPTRGPALPWPLTPRELDVLAALSCGRTNAEIAGELGVSAETVKTHVSRVIRKTSARNRTHAAVLARRAGLRG
jgi:DNA-binding CsgD family transcriptional regulator